MLQDFWRLCEPASRGLYQLHRSEVDKDLPPLMPRDTLQLEELLVDDLGMLGKFELFTVISIVAVDIERIPGNLRDRDCADVQSENIKEAIRDLIRSKDGPTELRSSISPEPLSPSPSGTADVSDEHIPAKDRGKPISHPALDDDTDDEIWAGKRTNARKGIGFSDKYGAG